MKTLTREGFQRMVKGGTTVVGGSGSGSGGSGGGGSADYAAEAGHAQTADHATTADEATHATTADTSAEATHATSADASAEATHALSADTATNATNANHATAAANLDTNSSDWQKIARKDSVQTIAEVWTFTKGIISTLKSYFRAGIEVAGGIIADTIGISGNATIGGTLGVNGKLTGTEAELQNLTVTKAMHVFKLTVDDLTSNKGAIIVTSANCTAEDVEEVTGGYTIYWENTDKDGNPVSNPWKVGDLALCLTYKGEGSGTFQNVVNRYYWRKVLDVQINVRHGGDDKWYNTITLSNAQGEYEGTTVPAVGDNIVQLGYNGQTADAARQTAVILSSYPTMDTGVTPPSLAFYKGINDFALASHRYTYIDGLNNEFMGNFKILVNGNYENLTTVLATLEGLLSVVQKTVIGKNIIPSEGWQDNAGNLLDSDTFIPSTQKLNAGTDDILYTPIMYLKAGAYVFSCYTDDADAEMYLYTSSTNKARPTDMSYGDTISFEGVVSGDTYTPSGGSALPRRYVVIEVQSDCYACLNIMDDVNDLIIYRPQLEEGSSATAWEIGNVEVRSSELKQAADLIRLQVGNCGLDLTNDTIIAKGGKFQMEDENGNATFVLDQNGNINGQGNATFGGVIRAKTLFRQVMQADIYYGSANFANADHSALNADFMIVIGSSSSTFTVNFPPAYLFPGALVRIITGRQNLVTYTLQIGRLSGEDGPHEESGAGNEAVDNFYAAIPFVNSGGTTIYGSRTQLTCNTYRTIDLIAAENPEYPNNYVWMVIDAK